MKLRYFNLVCLTIINLHFEYVSSINRAYDYFRILFDNQEILKPHDIDLITNQLMTNVSFFLFFLGLLLYQISNTMLSLINRFYQKYAGSYVITYVFEKQISINKLLKKK